jgi:hypothetical protein
MSKPLLCKHGYGAFACPHCPAAARRGRGGAIPWMVEEDRQRRELGEALSMLRELVALHYEKYTGKDVTWVTDRMAHEDTVWARARALVAEHTTNGEAT